LITSLRLVGRIQPGGALLSIWWSGLVGVQVDVDADTIRLDGDNGWRGQITGPGVAPIAIAAIAACHGPSALLVHPGLGRLRRPSLAEPSPAPEARSLELGDPTPTAWKQERPR
ncbi:MAG: hypothetical protein ACRDXE_05295, partial [Acidimicrobiales bacterium]